MRESLPTRRLFTLTGNVTPPYLAGAVIAGALYGLALPPFSLWPLALLSSCLFLLLIRGAPPVEARNLGLVYGLGLAASTLHWFANVFGVFALSLVGLFAAYYGLLANLAALTRERKPWQRTLATAAFAVGVEWIRGDAWKVRFPWYTMPHALAADPFFAATVRWTGTYGFSFLLWVAAAAGAFGKKRWWLGFLLLFLPAFFLPNPTPPDRTAILVQGEETTGIERILAEIPDTSASLVVLPEYSYFVSYESAVLSPRGPAALARRLRTPVVFGAIDGAFESGTFHNVAALLSETGSVVGLFPKQHPVPFVYDGLPGLVRPVFPAAGGILGIGVCYDFDAPGIAASLAGKGATVLVAPTFDALHWGELQHDHHELLVRLRALETNRWILRATSSGRTEVVDPRGYPSREGLEFGQSGFSYGKFRHISDIPPGAFLSWLGPVFALLSAVITILLFSKRGVAGDK